MGTARTERASTKGTTMHNDNWPADHLWAMTAEEALADVAQQQAEFDRVHAPVQGEDDVVECDDCTALRWLADTGWEDEEDADYMTDDDGRIICPQCFDRLAALRQWDGSED
jgi:hypothetical protein